MELNLFGAFWLTPARYTCIEDRGCPLGSKLSKIQAAGGATFGLNRKQWNKRIGERVSHCVLGPRS